MEYIWVSQNCRCRINGNFTENLLLSWIAHEIRLYKKVYVYHIHKQKKGEILFGIGFEK
jgi:hypothetical protein